MPSLSLLLKQANHLYKRLTFVRTSWFVLSSANRLWSEKEPTLLQAIPVVLVLAESSMHLSSCLHSLVLSGGYEVRLLPKIGFYPHEHDDARSFCTRIAFSKN